MSGNVPLRNLRQRRRCAVVLGGMMVLLIGLGGRLVHIQRTLGPRLTTLAQEQQQGALAIPATRGMILDVRGRTVAASRRQPDIFVDPSRVDDLPVFTQDLAARINVSPEEIRDRLARRPKSRYVIVAEHVDDVAADAVRSMHSPAVGLSDGQVRTYPLGRSVGQVVGLVGRDGHGLEGIELAYDKHLSGTDGQRSTIRDARRRALWRTEEHCKAPIDGGHVMLTIDAEIQRIAEAALEDSIGRFEAESGVSVVLSPATGEVLAMASWPAFDPNGFDPPGWSISEVGGRSGERPKRSEGRPGDIRRNRAVTDPVEPGSTIKAFVACGALEGGFVSPTQMIDCHMGTYTIGRRVVRDVHPYGMMDISGIIKKSSNIGMTIIGERMGRQALSETMHRFGFGKPTGIECPGESPGMVQSLRNWKDGTTQSVSFGYEIMMTPLQLAAAFAAIVNDGVLMKPRVVKRLLGPDGTVVWANDAPVPARRAVSSSVAAYVVDKMLVGVVEEGTGRGASLADYQVLGKTGTAKLISPNHKGYEEDAYLSTFIGAAPARAPRVVALVMVRRPNPKIGYYGGTVAAPAVGRILAETLAYLQVPPDKQEALALKKP